jgi:hypothetical protein
MFKSGMLLPLESEMARRYVGVVDAPSLDATNLLSPRLGERTQPLRDNMEEPDHATTHRRSMVVLDFDDPRVPLIKTRPLGKGTFGSVFECRLGGFVCAVKVVMGW